MGVDLITMWSGRAWRNDAEDWVRTTLDAQGINVTGPIEQPRVRPWSTQLTVPTDQGLVWFKENNPGQRAEAAIVQVLATVVPDHVVVPLAVEPERGWLLTPDHGATLRSLESTDEGLWTRVLTEYADLQRRLVPHEGELVAAGLERLTPQMCPAYVAEQVQTWERLPAQDPLHLDSTAAAELRASLPRLRQAADELAGGPVPMSLDHNDLHHNNAFAPTQDETGLPLRFFDFGDAVWAHPFSSLRVTLNVVTKEWHAAATDPRVRRLTDSYLEVWSDLADLTDLRRLLDLALEFAPIHRAESWRRLLAYADEATLAEFGSAPLTWLWQITAGG
ncbi:MAG: hypothetical protein ACRDQA_01515 [Nocardioidaceae bacterium]